MTYAVSSLCLHFLSCLTSWWVPGENSLLVSLRLPWLNSLTSSTFHSTYTFWSQSIPSGIQGGIWSRAHGEALLPGLFFRSCLTTFLIKPKVTRLGMMPPTVGWALPRQGAIKTILIAVPTGQYDLSNSSMEAGVRWLQTVSSWQLKLPRTNGCQTIMEESIGLIWVWQYCISVANIQSHSKAKRRLYYQKVSMFWTLKSVSPLCL